ncbi:hypothetical protein [Alteromonas sp. a30]|uniref:hypothetical protein n=1 Tax=Alteromonas sp. a30 TaxID=2730917 RepID=UPI00227E9014|nr:hypothetical protein [Alteromonas sp. a30]MCY7296513.1 hypothetical protein [Alteromonas sp. a30]
MKQILTKLLPTLGKSKLKEELNEKLEENSASKTEKGLWIGVAVLVLAAFGIEMAPETASQILEQLRALLGQ